MRLEWNDRQHSLSYNPYLQQGMLGVLIVWWPASFWLQWTVAESTVRDGSPAKFPTKPTEELTDWKLYVIKQIKICAEYRDMQPRPRLDLSGTAGLRPIGSWQTSFGLGSISRYSAQILICIIDCVKVPFLMLDLLHAMMTNSNLSRCSTGEDWTCVQLYMTLTRFFSLSSNS